MQPLYANIALNLPLDKLFTYAVPSHYTDKAAKGKRVLVGFGKKTYTGIILELTDKTELENVKNIKSVLDDERILNDEIIDFCKWVAEYYIAPLGEVLFSAVPRNINIRSEVYYSLEENYKNSLDESKNGSEVLIDIIRVFENSSTPKLTRNQVEKRLKSNDLLLYLNRLADAHVLNKSSLYTKPTREKIIKKVSRNYEEYELDKIISENKIRSEKQKTFLKLLLGEKELELSEAIKKTGISSSSVSSLLAKELITLKEERKMRVFETLFTERSKQVELTDEQKNALGRLTGALNENNFKPFLLHGITGSGKTEVYINAIADALKTNKTAIVLVPEISLTPQLIHRFKTRFGDIVGVIHSKISDGEKLDTYDSIRNGGCKIIIGARSALFAPLENIGIIIVDEEHDSSYKQENSPRYNGRDSAIVRAKMNNAVIVLGSATPSMESYFNAEQGKYELISLTHRATKINPPDIKIVDLNKKLKEELKEYLEGYSNKVKIDYFEFINKVKVKFLSRELIIEIDERLDRKESIILLQNRRGYHAYIECLNCANVEMCPRCSIALTYHKIFGLLKCHYCGFYKKMIQNCAACNSDRLVPKGAGTERVEEELIKLFPKAVIKRMDSDALHSKTEYQQILQDFYDGRINILVGTQMISKGLDFPDVTLVGVVNADIGLLNPDFRATEKTFQILTQVSGRSGRSVKAGEVYIQTNHPDYFVFETVRTHNYKAFYENELPLRKAVMYPPFSRLSIIEVRADDPKLAESKIKEIYNVVKSEDTENRLTVLPPNQPLFSKLKDMYRYHLLIKSLKEKDPAGSYMNKVLRAVKAYCDKNITSKVHVTFDIDAVNLL